MKKQAPKIKVNMSIFSVARKSEGFCKWKMTHELGYKEEYKIAIIYEGDSKYSVVRTQKQMQNISGKIGVYDTWRRYPSADRVTKQEAWNKAMSIFTKNKKETP